MEPFASFGMLPHPLYCSPFPEVPQAIAVPEVPPVPQATAVPHCPDVPQAIALSHAVDVPFGPGCRTVVPQTTVGLQVNPSHHAESGFSNSVAVCCAWLYEYCGEAADSSATSWLARAAAISKYPAPTVNMSYVSVYDCPVVGS